MKIKAVRLFLLLFSLILFSCKKDSNPVQLLPQPNINLEQNDVSCTESWVKIHINNIVLPAEFEVFLDSNLIRTLQLSNSDTLLLIDSLLPYTNYKMYVQSNSLEEQVISNIINVKTLDTTSHSFSWQTYELGKNGEDNAINDAFIFNENNVYAVGSIYLNDTTGQTDIVPYGLAKFDGNSWSYSKLEGKWPTGVSSFIVPSRILAFSENNIWYVDWGIHNWNGGNITSYVLNYYTGVPPDPIFTEDQIIRNIWGDRENNIYIGGLKGALAHFDGEKWSKIETNITDDMMDTYGIKNTVTNEYEIYCACQPNNNPTNSRILKVRDDGIEYLNYNEGYLLSVWGQDNNKIYGSGLSIFKNNTTGWKKLEFDDFYKKIKIRGNALNNIFVVGGYGFVGHFNGVTWEEYPGLRLQAGNYYSVTVKDNLVVICGFNNDKGIVVIGKQINDCI